MKLLFNFVKYQTQSTDFKVVTERLMKELKFNSKVRDFVSFHNNYITVDYNNYKLIIEDFQG